MNTTTTLLRQRANAYSVAYSSAALSLLFLLAGNAQAQLTDGQTIGIDFGFTTSTDPSSTWNHLSVGGDANNPGIPDDVPEGDFNGNRIVDAADYAVWRDTLGMGPNLPNADSLVFATPGTAHYDLWKANYGATSYPDSGSPNFVTLSSLSDTSGSAVSGVEFTLTNMTGQIAYDFGLGAIGAVGVEGNGGVISDSSVYGDSIISNDRPQTGHERPVDAGIDTFKLTFTGLDDSLTYDLVGGWDPDNANFNAVWSVGENSFTTDADAVAYGSLTGLATDGSGNLEITVTGIEGAAHVTIAALTLTAANPPLGSVLAVSTPEPASAMLVSMLLGLAFRSRLGR